MMKSLFKSSVTLLLALAAVTFSGCDDDEPKILGLNEAAKFGFIKLTLDGTRPDGVPFTATKKYRYITGFGPSGSSTYRTYEDDGIMHHELRATRLFNPFDSSPASANVTINMVEEDDELVLAASSFNMTSPLTFDDLTAHRLIISFEALDPEDITSHSYNEDTGKFKVKFTRLVDSESNSTNHELTVTGEASVTLFRPLE